MSRTTRTAGLIPQLVKGEAPANQNKAGTKGKDKKKGAEDKAAKANPLVEVEINSALVAKMADVVMNDHEISEKNVDGGLQVIVEKPASP